MAGGAGMTQYLVPRGKSLRKSRKSAGLTPVGGAVWAIYLNFNTFLSHRDRTSLRMSVPGSGVPHGASPCLDSSRRIRCRSTSRAFFWPLPSLLFRHVRFGQQAWLKAKQRRQLKAKNSLSLNQHLSLRSLCSLASTSKLVLGQAFAPVPTPAAQTMGVA